MFAKTDSDGCEVNDKIRNEILNYMPVVKDFPKPGIDFRDITPLFSNHSLLDQIVNWFANQVPADTTAIIGPELRGCLFGLLVARKLRLRFIFARKPGKLSPPVLRQSYKTEYSDSCLEIRQDDLSNHDKIFVIDDILATGGTIESIKSMIKLAGCSYNGFACLGVISCVADLSKLDKTCEKYLLTL